MHFCNRNRCLWEPNTDFFRLRQLKCYKTYQIWWFQADPKLALKKAPPCLSQIENKGGAFLSGIVLIERYMEKKKSPPAKLWHFFSFLFGDLKIKLDRSEQGRFVKMNIFWTFFWRGCNLLRLLEGNRILSKRCKLVIWFYEWQLTNKHRLIQILTAEQDSKNECDSLRYF